jgi:16S rRNA (cytosine967-C5)-methyltransferase
VSADGSDDTLLLTPARHGTDGFFIAVLVRTE